MPFTTQFKIVMYASSMIIGCTGILFTLLNRRTDKHQNKIYLALLIMVVCNCISEIIAAAATPYCTVSSGAAFAVKFGHFSYFLVHALISPMFYLYVLSVCGANLMGKRKRYIISFIPSILFELMVMVNPFTKLVYYYDRNMEYHRNWGLMLIYAEAGLYMMMAVFMLMFSWRALNTKRRTALIYFFFIVMIGLSVQLYNYDLRTELLSEIVALLGVMISIEIEDDRIDAGMGIYNRRALTADMNTYIVSGRSLYLLCVKITNTEIIKRATGSDNTDALSKLVAEYLKTLVPRYYIYSTNPDTFILTLMECDEQKAVWLAGTIASRFEQPWSIGDNEIPLRVMLMAADVPARIHNVSDALYMADSPVPTKVDKNILTGSDLDYLLRRAAVESSITVGLKDHFFEVFYQPTYYVKENRLHGAGRGGRLRAARSLRLYQERSAKEIRHGLHQREPFGASVHAAELCRAYHRHSRRIRHRQTYDKFRDNRVHSCQRLCHPQQSGAPAEKTGLQILDGRLRHGILEYAVDIQAGF